MKVKGGPKGHLRHKKVVKITKGQRKVKLISFKQAKEPELKNLWYATRDRRVRKRDLRKLWIARIDAAAQSNGTTYRKLLFALKKAGIGVDRESLADTAERFPDKFRLYVERAFAFATLAGTPTIDAPPPDVKKKKGKGK